MESRAHAITVSIDHVFVHILLRRAHSLLKSILILQFLASPVLLVALDWLTSEGNVEVKVVDRYDRGCEGGERARRSRMVDEH